MSLFTNNDTLKVLLLHFKHPGHWQMLPVYTCFVSRDIIIAILSNQEYCDDFHDCKTLGEKQHYINNDILVVTVVDFCIF